MEKYIDPKFLISWVASIWRHFVEVVNNTNTLIEVAVIIVGFLMAQLLSRPLVKRLQRVLDAQN